MIKKLVKFYIVKIALLGFIFSSPLFAHRRYVLTGGPGVGKSTIIEELKSNGHIVVPEAFTELFNEAKMTGVEKEIFNDPVLFRQTLMEKQRQLESALEPQKSAFLDRGKPDVVIYGDIYQHSMQQFMRDEAEALRCNYDLIFLISPIPKERYIFGDASGGLRQEPYEESLRIHKELKEGYRKLGFNNLIEVPFDTPENRVQFITKAINDYYFIADVTDDTEKK